MEIGYQRLCALAIKTCWFFPTYLLSGRGIWLLVTTFKHLVSTLQGLLFSSYHPNKNILKGLI